MVLLDVAAELGVYSGPVVRLVPLHDLVLLRLGVCDYEQVIEMAVGQ